MSPDQTAVEKPTGAELIRAAAAEMRAEIASVGELEPFHQCPVCA
jgi:hypothetical protein